jgi:hypothetical protein
LQIAANRCNVETSEAIGLQRQCSAPPLAEIASAFTFTTYGKTCYGRPAHREIKATRCYFDFVVAEASRKLRTN